MLLNFFHLCLYLRVIFSLVIINESDKFLVFLNFHIRIIFNLLYLLFVWFWDIFIKFHHFFFKLFPSLLQIFDIHHIHFLFFYDFLFLFRFIFWTRCDSKIFIKQFLIFKFMEWLKFLHPWARNLILIFWFVIFFHHAFVFIKLRIICSRRRNTDISLNFPSVLLVLAHLPY